jgi:uncharacterized protein (TIGR03435 family)
MAGGMLAGETPPLSFEVASVKPAEPCCAEGQWRESKVENGRVDFRYVTLKYCIAFAYGIKEYQVAGPVWLGEVRYDIVAKGAEGTRREKLAAMMQTLLAERFRLEIHHAEKEFSVFALEVDKNGAKLKKSAEEPGGPEGAAFGFSMSGAGVGKLEAKHCDMAALANTLPRLVGRPVVDRSGLNGRYDFDLEFSREDLGRSGLPDGPVSAGQPPTEFAISVFTSIRQIGLKLDPMKLPLDTVVVDRADKTPTGN